MLDALIKKKMRDSYEFAISQLGIPVLLGDSVGSQTNLVAGVKTIGPGDRELANAYGIGSKVFTVRQRDVLNPPKKFDDIELVSTGERFTVSAVSEVSLNGEVVGYRLATAGK